MTGSIEEIRYPRGWAFDDRLLFRPGQYQINIPDTPRWLASEIKADRLAEQRRAAYQAARHPNAKARRRAQKAGRKASR